MREKKTIFKKSNKIHIFNLTGNIDVIYSLWLYAICIWAATSAIDIIESIQYYSFSYFLLFSLFRILFCFVWWCCCFVALWKTILRLDVSKFTVHCWTTNRCNVFSIYLWNTYFCLYVMTSCHLVLDIVTIEQTSYYMKFINDTEWISTMQTIGFALHPRTWIKCLWLYEVLAAKL